MSEATVHIRLAVPSDVHDIHACARAAYKQYIVRMNREPAPMLADFGQQVSEGIVSVAIIDNKLVGYVVFYPDSDFMHLENVAVLPSHSGLNIGKQLIRHAEEQAVVNGFTQVALYTNEMMYENLAMYTKLGYIETERKTQEGFNRVFFTKNVLV